ncbi:MAG: NADH-quinone oxidoreductase subunit NuoK [Acidobacteria bacterium]|nr:NADH-quinone oxidoreductase subunit NuoK [Acidobacteriota bacterium]
MWNGWRICCFRSICCRLRLFRFCCWRRLWGRFFWRAGGRVNVLHPVGTGHYLVLSLALLLVGILGVLTRRNLVIVLMSVELILNAVNINLIAFSKHTGNLAGQVFAIFVITLAVAEAAVGLGLLIALFRNRETTSADEVNLLRW